MRMLRRPPQKFPRAGTWRKVGVAQMVESSCAGFLVHYSQVIHKRLRRLRRCGLRLVIGLLTNKEKAGSEPGYEVPQSRIFDVPQRRF